MPSSPPTISLSTSNLSAGEPRSKPSAMPGRKTQYPSPSTRTTSFRDHTSSRLLVGRRAEKQSAFRRSSARESGSAEYADAIPPYGPHLRIAGNGDIVPSLFSIWIGNYALDGP